MHAFFTWFGFCVFSQFRRLRHLPSTLPSLIYHDLLPARLLPSLLIQSVLSIQEVRSRRLYRCPAELLISWDPPPSVAAASWRCDRTLAHRFCKMYFTCMWSAPAQLPALSANAWRQSWSVHISASAHASSSWTRTISNTNVYIGALIIFLLNALFKDLSQAIVQVFTRKYRVA